MTAVKLRNSSWKINDGFDSLRSNNFQIWINNFNHYSNKAGATKLVIDKTKLAKAMSLWYISIKIIKYWNGISESNNHWKENRDVLVYYDDTYTIRELWQELNWSEGEEVYKFETIRRYVGEMCAVGLLRRAGNVATGRIQPSSYLARAVGMTQKQWMHTYQSLTKAMSENLMNSNSNWDVFEYGSVSDKDQITSADDRAKAQFL